jgi:hypothetical protein
MRAERSRAKKLVVAFHFQVGNQAAWKCDVCRKSGLETKRQCGWLNGGTCSPGKIVWARGRVSVTTCPTSYVTAESLALLEEFHAWKLAGMANVYDLPARLVEAIFILENEWTQEKNNAQV